VSNNFEAYYYGGEDEESIRVKAREKSEKAPKIMFARWGGLNPKRDKNKEKIFGNSQSSFAGGFHHPPEHKGIYAFIWPYVEPFLAGWNREYWQKTGKKDEDGRDEVRFKPIKKFQHYGDIWCHFVEEARELGLGKEYKGTWVKVDTKNLQTLLSKIIAKDIGSLQSDKSMREKPDKVRQIANPFKRGKGGFMSRDHLEVFIPEKVRETK
jgi:hypothetical protein